MKLGRRPRVLLLALLVAGLLALLGGCGGGGGAPASGPPPPPPPPPPGGLTITTTALPGGVTGAFFNAALAATGGTGTLSWSLTFGSGPLPPGLNLNSAGVISGTPTTTGTFNFTIQVQDSSTPPQTDTQDLSITVTAGTLAVATTSLPGGTLGVPYFVVLAAGGGTAPFTWSIMSTLPSGLSLDAATGTISGTPDMVQTEPFTVQVQDSSNPQETDTQDLSITINAVGALGRNDSIGDATPLSNGTFRASISPFSDPIPTVNPDNDFYEVMATAGATVTVEIFARRSLLGAPLDSVMEIVNASGTRFTTCRNEGTSDGVNFGSVDPTPTAFDDVCLNDDIDLGVIQDSKLEFQVPGAGTVTFYVRVLDFRGDARPDMIYDITISGAN